MAQKRIDVGSRIRTRRMYCEWSQSVLARKCGLKASAISHFETGRRRPSVENLIRLCESLDCSADYILGLSARFK